MDVVETEIPDVKRIVPKHSGNVRGWFSEGFRADAMACAGITATLRPDTSSYSAPQSTIRDLHAQIATRVLSKLIYMIQCAIREVTTECRHRVPALGSGAVATESRVCSAIGPDYLVRTNIVGRQSMLNATHRHDEALPEPGKTTFWPFRPSREENVCDV